MQADILVESPVKDMARVLQLRGLFDLPASSSSRTEWKVDLPIDDMDWNIGLIVGPSGSGKSTIARELWPKELSQSFKWPRDESVVDGFPKTLAIKEITGLLSSVGFSSPPSWLQPYGTLSTGEQFRVSMARTLAESQDLAVVDEFTSVVDRTVAQIGSAAIAKTVRRRKQRLVAVTCHEDVAEWLQPDWIYRPSTGDFSGRWLQSRPPIELAVCRVPAAAWQLFAHHHYLDAGLHSSAVCFGAFWRDRLVAFCGWLPHVGRTRGLPIRRVTRIVVLPDYQGVGIGQALMRQTAGMWGGLGSRATITTSHPGMVESLNHSRVWAMTRKPQRSSRDASEYSSVRDSRATRRLVASFEYVGPPLPVSEARGLRHCQPSMAR